MKILVLGAGATGGYFGGRLLEAGVDVSFLLRKRRAIRVRDEGLLIRSPQGDARLKPRVILAGELKQADESFDWVMLACKAYDLDAALDAIAPVVARGAQVLPLLNGLRHFDVLDARFGADAVIGGLCSIAVTLGADGAVEHLARTHMLRFGERDGSRSARIIALEKATAKAKMDAKSSRNIVPALWEKWVMLASLASMNCLMRASISDILAAPHGLQLCRQMLEECIAVATANGQKPRPQVLADIHSFLDNPSGAFTASMLRDLEHGYQVEADHIVGDLIARGTAAGVSTPLLQIAYCNLKAYESRRTRKA